MKNNIPQAESQVKRFVLFVEQIFNAERLQKFNEFEPEKIIFYIIYATCNQETSVNFEKLVNYIKIHGSAEIDREMKHLLEYMQNHRDQCRRYEDINLATLKFLIDNIAAK